MGTRTSRLARFALAVVAFAIVAALSATAAFAASTYFEQYPAVNGVCSEPMPKISVKVSDPAGISTGFQFKLDGVSKTPKVTWGPGSSYCMLSYQVPSPLKNGVHTVYASVYTGAGRTSTTWTFTENLAPQLGPLAPADGSTVDTQKPTISAGVTTNGTTLSSYTMTVDGQGVIPTYDAAAKTISYVPSTRLANDRTHTASITVVDSAGGSATVSWSFRVQIYASMVDTAGCTDCHSAYPASHPMNDCNGCHAANGPFSACWNMDDPQQYAHPSDYLLGIDCAYCHASQFPTVPRHPDNLDVAHETTTDMSGCACHVSSLTVEHNRYTDAATGEPKVTCASCHEPSDPKVVSAMNSGSRYCADCHTIPAGHPYTSIDHVADVAETADLSGKKCGECHEMDLMTEHEKATSSSAGRGCSTCHDTPRDTFAAWNQSCSQGGCHASGSATAMHANASTAHDPGTSASSCTGAGCHSFTDVASLHSAASTVIGGVTYTSCNVCHRPGGTATKDCATCHPERLQPHGYEAAMHTATDSTSLTCASSGCHDTAEAAPLHPGGCATCHRNPTKGDLTADKTRFACKDCHVIDGTDYHANFAEKHTYSAMDASCQSSGCHVSSLVSAHQAFVGAGSRYPQYADTCSLCHHNSDASRIPSGATAACSSCHTIHADIPAVHSSSTDCFGNCHTAQVESTTHVSSCSVCHQSAESRVVSAISGKNTDCQACHRAGSGYVDADGNAYALVGAAHDGVQPAITGVSINYAGTNAAAPLISWTTDRPTTTYVDYADADWSYDGLQFGGYTHTAGTATLSTTHSVSFPAASYSSSSGYYYCYRIRTVDANGKQAVTPMRIYHRNRSGATNYVPGSYEPDYGSLNTDYLKLNVVRPNGSRLTSVAVAGWESQSSLVELPTPSAPGAAIAQTTLDAANSSSYIANWWRTKLAATDGAYNWQVAKFRLDPSATTGMQGLELSWTGYAENSDGHPVVLYLWNFDTKSWERMDRRQSTGDNRVTQVFEASDAQQSYCLRCHSTPVADSVTMPSGLTNLRSAWNTDFHGAGAGSGYGGTLKAPFSRGQAALSCDECHEPAAHGSSANTRKIKATVNGATVSFGTGSSTGAQSLCSACHEGTPNELHATCIACHENPGAHGVDTSYHINTTEADLKDFTNADCLSCHKHGETGYAPGCHGCHGGANAGPFTTF